MAEKLPERRLYKLMLGVLKVIPMLLALLAIFNMVFDFAGIDSSILSLLGGMAGDSARALAKMICELGCPDCRR